MHSAMDAMSNSKQRYLRDPRVLLVLLAFTEKNILRYIDMKRKSFNTTLDEDLMKKIKILAIQKDLNVNDLIEEGLKIVLDIYKEG